MATIDRIITALFLLGLAVAPEVTGKRRLVFLAVTLVVTLFSISIGNILVLYGYALGAMIGAYWRRM